MEKAEIIFSEPSTNVVLPTYGDVLPCYTQIKSRDSPFLFSIAIYAAYVFKIYRSTSLLFGNALIAIYQQQCGNFICFPRHHYSGWLHSNTTSCNTTTGRYLAWDAVAIAHHCACTGCLCCPHQLIVAPK